MQQVPQTADQEGQLRRIFARLVALVRSRGSAGEVARGATGTLMVSVSGAGFMYLAQMLLARTLGPDQFGIYAYAVSWAEMLLIFSRIGLDFTIIRYGAAYSANNDWGAFRGLTRWSDIVAFPASSAVGLALALGAYALGDRISTELRNAFFLAGAMVPVMVVGVLREATVRSLGHGVLARSMSGLVRPLTLIAVTAALALWLGDRFSGVEGVAAHAAAVTMMYVVAAAVVARKCRPLLVGAPEATYHAREWLLMALPALFISSMSMILSYTDKVMIGALIGTSQAGVYVVVTKTVTLIAMGLNSVNQIVGPMISRLYTRGEMAELQRVLRYAALGAAGLGIPVALVMIGGGRLVLLLFGPEFVSGYWPLVIRTCGQLANALAGSTGLLMMMTGRQNAMSVMFGVCAAINVGLNVVLIPRLELVGAALATAGCLVLWNVMAVVYVVRVVGLDASIVAWLRRPPGARAGS